MDRQTDRDNEKNVDHTGNNRSEKKLTQRIIGIVIVVALIIILLPLLFSRGGESHRIAAEKAAPIAETPASNNQAQLAANENTVAPINNSSNSMAASTSSTNEPVVNKVINPSGNEITVVGNNEVAAQNNKPAPVAQVMPNQPEQQAINNGNAPMVGSNPEANTSVNTADVANPNAGIATVANQSSGVIPVEDNSAATKPLAKHETHTMTKHKKLAHKSLTSHTGQWVVQVGSFKVKQNAERLAEKLRKHGHQVILHKTASGATQVWVGPGMTLSEAKQLSFKLGHELHLPHDSALPIKRH